MSWYVNINKHVIAANARNKTDNPPVRISNGKAGKGIYCREAALPAGSKIIYSADQPILKCGARLVIECPTQPEVLK